METIALGQEADLNRETFFNLLFGDATGLLCLGFITRSKVFSEEFFKFPEEMDLILNRINEKILGNNLYFCSQLLSKPRRVKENVIFTPNVWADLDRCPPEKMLLAPSVVLETSPNSFQAFWLMDRCDYDPDDIEELSRRIAYHHKVDGVDSGWGLTKLLRVPVTYNYKYPDPPVVKVIEISRLQYTPEQFDYYPPSDDYIKIDTPLPEIDEAVSAEDLLQSNRHNITPIIWNLFNITPNVEEDWSRLLWRLLVLLYESGFTQEQVFTIARSAKCNKYARDLRPTTQLWKDVVRAKRRYETANQILEPDELIAPPTTLLSEQEYSIVRNAPPTFVERYITWATSLGDAASQYHQAGAIVALSAILSGSVFLPTSYGTIIPNVWFMILAPTTISRKTTSMDIAMDLIADVDDDMVLATDGSIEGLLTALSTRPGKPSIFLRDEFSGLLDQMTHKDYMSGMAELLTKLYDNKMQKRVLRKDIVEVREPRLIIYAGGIKDNVTSILDKEHVSSGFLPRFIFITAENDVSRIRPIGPPTNVSLEARTKILLELQNLYDHYNQLQTLTVAGTNATVQRPLKFEVSMTPEAWFRYNQVEAMMLQEGMDSNEPDVMIPINDRLSKSILKAAILIAASHQIGDDVVVDVIDILRAAKYGEEWAQHSKTIVNNVGKGANERLLERILNKIKRHEPQGIKRSLLMQQLHLGARETTLHLETLKQRDLIAIARVGKTDYISVTPLGMAQ